MPRAPFQILVFLYSFGAPDGPRYAVFRRADLGVWQGVAGGGEANETPEQAARRETAEEVGLGSDVSLVRLTTVGQVPVTAFPNRDHWPADLHTIPEYSFAAAVDPQAIRCSGEHDALEWLPYERALARLEWASNRLALMELHRQLVGASTPGDPPVAE